MWQIEDLSIGDGQLTPWSPPQASCLLSAGVVLSWPAELGDWSASEIKVELCHLCSETSCQGGGWISLRRAGQLILITPAISPALVAARRGSPFNRSNPHFIYGGDGARPFSRRIPYMNSATYGRLGTLVRGLPPLEQVSVLTASEAAHLHELESPFPGLPNARMRRRLDATDILETSWSSRSATATAFNQTYRSHFRSNAPVTLRPLAPTDSCVVSVRPNTRDRPIWRPITVGAECSLIFEPGFVVEAA